MTFDGVAASPEQAARVSRRLRPLAVAVGLQSFMLWVPVEKVFMTQIGFTPATIGIIAAIYAGVTPLLEVPFGVVADRWSRSRMLAIAGLALAASSLVGGLSTSPQTYAIAAALLGVFFALQSGMADSIVYDTLIEETGSGADYERRIGRLHAVEAGSLVLSAVVGGVLAALVSARFTYFATIPLVLVSMVALWRCPEPRLHRHAERVRYRQQASQTMRALGANRVVRRAVLLAALVAAASQTLFEFGPLWLVQLHAPDVLYGPYWGAIVSTVGIGAFCASRLPLDRTSALVLIATGLIASTIASAVVANLAVVIVAHVIALLLLAVVGVRAGFLLHEAVAASVRAGVSSGASTLSWAVFLPVSLVFGALARAHGVESAGWLVVGLAGALAVLLVRMPSPDPALDEVAVADLGVAQPLPTPA